MSAQTKLNAMASISCWVWAISKIFSAINGSVFFMFTNITYHAQDENGQGSCTEVEQGKREATRALWWKDKRMTHCRVRCIALNENTNGKNVINWASATTGYTVERCSPLRGQDTTHEMAITLQQDSRQSTTNTPVEWLALHNEWARAWGTDVSWPLRDINSVRLAIWGHCASMAPDGFIFSTRCSVASNLNISTNFELVTTVG